MFSLTRRFSCKKIVQKLRESIVENIRRISVDSDSKNDNKKSTKVSPIDDSSCRYNGNESSESSIKSGDVKVGIIGGGMAPIYAALILKQSRLIKRINIADPKDTLTGAVFDLNHIDTSTRIKYYGKKSISEALIDVDIVALMDETDFDMGTIGPASQFLVTSNYVRKMSEYMIQTCPTALAAIFARPITATLPMISEIFKCAGCWEPNRVVGSTALDVMRIESMTARLFDLNPAYVSVPVVGGADPCTVVPLLTKARPVNQFSSEHEDMLIHQLRAADKELASSVKSFKGPSLSTGAAAAKFILALVEAISGHPNVICSAYVRSDVLPVCRFFANEIHFGPRGVHKNLGLPKVSPKAVDLIEQAIPYINEFTEMAVNSVNTEKTAKIKV